MGNIKFLIDLGSTFTKVAVIDLETGKLLSRIKTPSTVEEDVTIGLRGGISDAEREAGVKAEKESVLACSSAAGGLRMICVGLVPSLSLKAATQAALGAGAKLVGSYFSEIGPGEVREIEKLLPDIILLSGGTDGGDKGTILHNAGMLAGSKLDSPIIVAGNKMASAEVASILTRSKKKVRCVSNVMPGVDSLVVEPCREAIRQVFVENIVKAKGIEKAREIVKEVIMPTPTAVVKAATLLAQGIDGEDGMGEIMVVDVGGATTDIHSIAENRIAEGVVYGSLLPEPFVKRTVEGDLGVRHNVVPLVKLGMARKVLSKEDEEFARRFSSPAKLPETEEEALFDLKMAQIATEVAVERHVGKIELWHGPQGKTMIQSGKDLRGVSVVIGTGGPIVFAHDHRAILMKALFNNKSSNLLKPVSPALYLDCGYILYAIGLLSDFTPKAALKVAKNYVREV
ncbi:MAG: methylaspartate mutase accessory protein GlmL [Syntrophales bacterium]|nr:methylaspartate mutase accessory protein GlmL [Syntrophales bacterium]